jgi:hypothetical protein
MGPITQPAQGANSAVVQDSLAIAAERRREIYERLELELVSLHGAPSPGDQKIWGAALRLPPNLSPGSSQ